METPRREKSDVAQPEFHFIIFFFWGGVDDEITAWNTMCFGVVFGNWIAGF